MGGKTGLKLVVIWQKGNFCSIFLEVYFKIGIEHGTPQNSGAN